MRGACAQDDGEQFCVRERLRPVILEPFARALIAGEIMHGYMVFHFRGGRERNDVVSFAAFFGGGHDGRYSFYVLMRSTIQGAREKSNRQNRKQAVKSSVRRLRRRRREKLGGHPQTPARSGAPGPH